MLFPVLKHEETVQVDDRTRLDASASYSSPNSSELTKIEVKTDTGEAFIDITSAKHLDWQYSSAGTKTVTVRLNESATEDFEIEVISEADDKLYSNDQKLKTHEPDILKWVEKGRNSYKNIHRRVQALIIYWLDKEGFVDDFGNKLTKEHLVDKEEVTEWATFFALELIFEGISNAIDDIHAKKALRYAQHKRAARNRAVLRLDLNKDGEISDGEQLDAFGQGTVIRQ